MGKSRSLGHIKSIKIVSRLPGLSMLRSTSRCCQFDTVVRNVSGCLMLPDVCKIGKCSMPGRSSSILVRFAKHHSSTAGTHWTSCFWPRHASLDGSKAWFRRTLWKGTLRRAHFRSLHQHLISPFNSFPYFFTDLHNAHNAPVPQRARLVLATSCPRPGSRARLAWARCLLGKLRLTEATWRSG